MNEFVLKKKKEWVVKQVKTKSRPCHKDIAAIMVFDIMIMI